MHRTETAEQAAKEFREERREHGEHVFVNVSTTIQDSLITSRYTHQAIGPASKNFKSTDPINGQEVCLREIVTCVPGEERDSAERTGLGCPRDYRREHVERLIIF